MSQASLLEPETMVARSRYDHLRAFFAAALVEVIGLIVAVVLLASSQGGGTTSVTVSPGSSVFQTGAKLDHRGLDTSQSPAAQTGAKLHHSD